MEIIQRYPGAKVVTAGYTDAKGADSYNLQLSTRRAESVKAWLARQGGIDEKQRQETAAFKAQYARRAGMEGIRHCGLRRTRYVGLAKTHLQHLLTVVALNVVWLGEWWLGTPQAKTRCSPSAPLWRAVASVGHPCGHPGGTHVDPPVPSVDCEAR